VVKKEMSTSEKEAVKVQSGLSVRAIIISIVLLVTATIIGDLTWLYTSKSGTINAFFVPFIYIVLVNELIGRINKNWRLKAQELTVIFPSILLVDSVKWMHKGAISGGEAVIGMVEKTLMAFIGVLNDPTWSGYYRSMTPSFMFPASDSLAVSILVNGLKPGQVFPFGEFLVPILYWSTYTILTYFLCLFLAFGIYGTPWVETEKLVFPISLPTTYLINTASSIDETTNKSKLFNLKDPTLKVFWIAFFVGVVLSLIPIIGEVIPVFAVWGAFAWGEQPLLLTFLPSIFPGAMAKGVMQIDLIALWILLPNEILLTNVIAYVIFGFLYQWLATLLGIIPYHPGVEFLWNWESMPGNWDPFPYHIIGELGMMGGLGVMTLYNLRGRIKTLINALKGQDVSERGLSLKTISTFGVAVVVLLFLLFVASGVPIVIAILMLLLAIIWYTSLARVFAILWWAPDDLMGDGGVAYFYGTGAVLGYWPSVLPSTGNPSQSWFVTSQLLMPFDNCWTLRVSGLGPGGSVGYFKIAHDTNTNLKDAFLAVVLVVLIGVPLAYATDLYFVAHGGGVTNTNSWGSWTGWWKASNYVTSVSGLMPIGATSYVPAFIYGAIGFILFLFLYFMRAHFAWWFIDPTAFVASVAVGLIWTWLSSLLALVLKIILVRALGVRKFEQYALPIATGLTLGFGAPILFSGLLEFFTVVLPRFLSFYVP
jgi:hypothetical protein